MDLLFLFTLLSDGEYQETEGDFISITAVVSEDRWRLYFYYSCCLIENIRRQMEILFLFKLLSDGEYQKTEEIYLEIIIVILL